MPVTRVSPQPQVVVEAPTRETYDFGLFSVLDFGNGDRAGLPINWRSLGFLLPAAIQDICLHGADPHTKVNSIICDAVYSTGFTVVAYDTSSLASRGVVDAALAVQQLEYAEQTTVEGHLVKLISEHDVVAAPVVGVSPYTPAIALATIEQRLAERGLKGTIIMSRFLASILGLQLVVDGDNLHTKLGTPVAAFGAPFAPALDVLGVYGVTGLQGVRGPVTSDAAPNKAVNDLSAFAERDYSLGFESDVLVAVATTA